MCYFLPDEIYGAFIRECIQLIKSLKLWIVAVNTIWPWSFQELETFWPLNCNLMNGVVQNETPVLEVVTYSFLILYSLIYKMVIFLAFKKNKNKWQNLCKKLKAYLVPLLLFLTVYFEIVSSYKIASIRTTTLYVLTNLKNVYYIALFLRLSPYTHGHIHTFIFLFFLNHWRRGCIYHVPLLLIP